MDFQDYGYNTLARMGSHLQENRRGFKPRQQRNDISSKSRDSGIPSTADD